MKTRKEHPGSKISGRVKPGLWLQGGMGPGWAGVSLGLAQEFQSKFYKADGYAFEPFCHRDVLHKKTDE